jgi:hypothetical protein
MSTEDFLAFLPLFCQSATKNDRKRLERKRKKYLLHYIIHTAVILLGFGVLVGSYGAVVNFMALCKLLVFYR